MQAKLKTEETIDFETLVPKLRITLCPIEEEQYRLSAGIRYPNGLSSHCSVRITKEGMRCEAVLDRVWHLIKISLQDFAERQEEKLSQRKLKEGQIG